jgi:hypothetical protein
MLRRSHNRRAASAFDRVFVFIFLRQFIDLPTIRAFRL